MLSAGLSAVCCPLRFLRPTLRPSLASCAVRGRSPYTACSGCAAVCSASATHSRWPLVVAALRAIAQQVTPCGPGGTRGAAPAQPRRHLAAIGAWIMQQAARPGSRCCRRAATSASQVTCGRVQHVHAGDARRCERTSRRQGCVRVALFLPANPLWSRGPTRNAIIAIGLPPRATGRTPTAAGAPGRCTIGD